MTYFKTSKTECLQEAIFVVGGIAAPVDLFVHYTTKKVKGNRKESLAVVTTFYVHRN